MSPSGSSLSALAIRLGGQPKGAQNKITSPRGLESDQKPSSSASIRVVSSHFSVSLTLSRLCYELCMHACSGRLLPHVSAQVHALRTGRAQATLSSS